MDSQKDNQIMNYKIAMGMAREMVQKGIISEEEFNKINDKISEKYCINFDSIFRENGLKSLDKFSL